MVAQPSSGAATWRLLICVLGPLRVLAAGQPVPVHGEKTAALLCYLAVRYGDVVPRESILEAVWPETDATLAAHALHNRVHSLHKLLGPLIDGAPPVVYADGCYRLNDAAGVGVDATLFEELVRAGDQHMRADHIAAAAAYQQAVQLYQGDLWAVAPDVQALMERERLRASHLTVLAWLADYAYGEKDYATCLTYARRLLSHDPCREDAHRLIMRCHVRLGERAQALHQYRLCEEILRDQFAAALEPETVALFEQVRLDPRSI